MNNCLVMITNEYPFMVDEAFLESEMHFLEKEFDKIIIFSTEVNPDSKRTRDIPENADCYNTAVRNMKISRTGDLIKGFFNSFHKSDYYIQEKDRISGSIVRRIFLEYFHARSIREFVRCREILKNYNFKEYDSVTVYSYWFFVTAMVGTMLKDVISADCKNVKLISRAHGYDIYKDRNKLNYLPMRKYLLQRYDAVFPCSVNGEEEMIKEFPEFSDKISHSYLGTFDRGLSLGSDSGIQIVSCSRITNVKRVGRIVDSLALLKNKSISPVWTHIGNGEDEAEFRNNVKKALGFMDVRLIGRLKNCDVYRFYSKNRIDLFINVSSSEGLPVSIMEAISFGIPVIATDVGGVSEIVKDGYNGWLLDRDFSNEELAEKIMYAYSLSDSEKESFRRHARSVWEENFNAEKNYSEFAKEAAGMKTAAV